MANVIKKININGVEYEIVGVGYSTAQLSTPFSKTINLSAISESFPPNVETMTVSGSSTTATLTLDTVYMTTGTSGVYGELRGTVTIGTQTISASRSYSEGDIDLNGPMQLINFDTNDTEVQTPFGVFKMGVYNPTRHVWGEYIKSTGKMSVREYISGPNMSYGSNSTSGGSVSSEIPQITFDWYIPGIFIDD